MKRIETWMRNHPLLVACGISALSAAVITIVIISDFLSECLSGKLSVVDMSLSVLLPIVIALLFWGMAKLRKPIVAVIVACLLFQAPQARALPICLGVLVVVIIGGVAGCNIIKKGGNIAKGRTNGWPEEFHVAGEDPYECGAVFTWVETDCYEERTANTNRTPVVFTMDIFVASQTNCQMTLSVQVGSQFVQTMDGLKEGVAGHGLFVPDSPRISECYERNMQPCAAEQVSIRFDYDSHRVTIGSGGVVVDVFESNDPTTGWALFGTFNVEELSEFTVPHVSYDKHFYRAVVR